MADGDLYFPPVAGDEWEGVDAASIGWDAARLAELLDLLAARDSAGVVILHRGRIVAERYWQGADMHDTGDLGSAQKPVVSFQLAVAQRDGGLSLDDPVAEHLGRAWTRTEPALEDAITLRHLVTMTSGLTDAFAFEATPGTAWYYNNNAYHQSKTVLERATGTSIEAFTQERLFGPIGARDSSWVLRPTMLDPLGKAMTGLHMSCRDMARFGLLMLAGGSWDRRSLGADAGYLAEATRPSQHLNPSYGYLWWVNGQDRLMLPGRRPARRGPFAAPAPADLFAATGAGDQKLYVCPSAGVVVARRGAPGGPPSVALSSFDNDIWARLAAVIGG